MTDDDVIGLTINAQVYRHLLFNRLGREDDRFDVSPLSNCL